jgi:peptidoglycan/LPS O-acetylase OafA/YrhL
LLGFIAGRSRQPFAALLSLAILVLMFHQFGWHNTFELGMLQAFLGGIVAAHWVRSPMLAALARTTAAGLLAIVALSAVVALLPTAFTWQATLGLTVFFVVIASGHSLWGALRLPGLIWLGDISYSIYLLHAFLLWLVFQRLLPHEAGVGGWVFLGVAVVVDVMLVLICSAVFLAIERPAIVMGKRHYYHVRRLGAALRVRLATRS